MMTEEISKVFSRLTVPLKEYLMELMMEKTKNIERSIELAKLNLDQRLEASNELLKYLKNQSESSATRVAVDLKFDKIEGDLRNIREYLATIKGKADQSAVIVGYVISLIACGIAIAAMFYK
jgi:orotidine-5'-phosphate decarboxylase